MLSCVWLNLVFGCGVTSFGKVGPHLKQVTAHLHGVDSDDGDDGDDGDGDDNDGDGDDDDGDDEDVEGGDGCHGGNSGDGDGDGGNGCDGSKDEGGFDDCRTSASSGVKPTSSRTALYQ